MRSLVLAVMLLLAGCGSLGDSETGSPGKPGRYADYGNDGTASTAQCHLPVEERVGAWFCPEGR